MNDHHQEGFQLYQDLGAKLEPEQRQPFLSLCRRLGAELIPPVWNTGRVELWTEFYDRWEGEENRAELVGSLLERLPKEKEEQLLPVFRTLLDEKPPSEAIDLVAQAAVFSGGVLALRHESGSRASGRGCRRRFPSSYRSRDGGIGQGGSPRGWKTRRSSGEFLPGLLTLQRSKRVREPNG